MISPREAAEQIEKLVPADQIVTGQIEQIILEAVAFGSHATRIQWQRWEAQANEERDSSNIKGQWLGKLHLVLLKVKELQDLSYLAGQYSLYGETERVAYYNNRADALWLEISQVMAEYDAWRAGDNFIVNFKGSK